MIYSTAIVLAFTGFFMLYNTSAKNKLSSAGIFEWWLQQNRSAAKAGGVLLLLFSFTIWLLKQGLAVGILSGLLLLMTASALIILLAPFHYIKLKHVVALLIGSVLIECLF